MKRTMTNTTVEKAYDKMGEEVQGRYKGQIIEGVVYEEDTNTYFIYTNNQGEYEVTGKERVTIYS